MKNMEYFKKNHRRIYMKTLEIECALDPKEANGYVVLDKP